MSLPVRFVRAHPFAVFVVLACGFGWAQFLLSAFGVGSAPDQIPLGPFVGAVIVTSIQGGEVRRAWWLRIRTVRIPVRWIAVVTLIPIAVHVAIMLVNHGFGAPLPTSAQLADWPNIPVVLVAMLVLSVSEKKPAGPRSRDRCCWKSTVWVRAGSCWERFGRSGICR